MYQSKRSHCPTLCIMEKLGQPRRFALSELGGGGYK